MSLGRRGFTLIEVLVALFILTGAIIVVSQAWSGNFMRMRKSALFYDVGTLLERKMVETEAKYRDKPLSEIPEEDGGDFGTTHPQYTWKMKSRDLKLPDLTPIIMGQQKDGVDESLLGMLKQVSESLSKAIKEVKVSIMVKRGPKQLEFAATQYFVDYTVDFTGGLGGAGGGGNNPNQNGSQPGSQPPPTNPSSPGH